MIGERMKIVGISGSPRKGGNTEILIKEALKGAEEEGCDTEFISLAGKDIKHCLGCPIDECKEEILSDVAHGSSSQFCAACDTAQIAPQ